MPKSIVTRAKDLIKKSLADRHKKAKKLQERIAELSRFPVTEAQKNAIQQMRLQYSEESRLLGEKYMEIELKIMEGNLPLVIDSKGRMNFEGLLEGKGTKVTEEKPKEEKVDDQKKGE